MKYTVLPGTTIKVSKICLGTMTWGRQNTEEDGHEQLKYAFDQGVNFVDTAELYAVPSTKETQGKTEEIIGTWFQKNKNRDQCVLASKIAGPAEFTKHIRTGGYKKEELSDAIEKSLKRLQTDYIDLYQLHWPERQTNYFGKKGYQHNESEEWKDNFNQILLDLQSFIDDGKIRHIGVSNESAYGLMRYVEESRNGMSRIVSVQNPYSLLNRKDEIGITEVLHRENVGYLAYSPLGFGMLSGKYLEGTPKGSRYELFPNYNRYMNENSFKATHKYLEIAKDAGLSLTDLSLAFVNQQAFVTSTIIGATKMEQLTENINSINVTLSDDTLKAIDKVHEKIPNPAP
ncbi:aldo/keto reductase [Aquimarina sp. ERC-38]|uniref:aldo/keto reductase n=1 Tax=Aquimarina sp. ERC-38 TaxID=2949996 RepID=UPI002245B2D8|nr:aldo/keto reductase [Aquimarina sp. ERC-38]UZO82154.1 aldo/keto reductase [Aquimarina sp. ERC-38]